MKKGEEALSPTSEQTAALIEAVSTERTRLVRLCTQLSGNADVAEDLAQETLSEAWQHLHKLSVPSGVALWLTAIARNVCQRWLSQQGKQVSLLRLDEVLDDSETSSTLELCSIHDVELELERHEQLDLLEKALALLTPEARTLFIAHYTHELSHAEIAIQLRISEDAVKMRVQRARQALRRVLTTQLSQEALSYGLLHPAGADWQQTHMWCPGCGQHRLLCHFLPGSAAYALRCPTCHAAPGTNYVDTDDTGGRLNLFQGVTQPKPLLSRLMAWGGRYYPDALATRKAACIRCGGPTLLRLGMPEQVAPPQRDRRGLHLVCLHCRSVIHISLVGLALWLPEGCQFWRAHPRIRVLPEREVERAEGCMIVISFQSVTDSAQLHVLFAQETYEVLHVYTDSAG